MKCVSTVALLLALTVLLGAGALAKPYVSAKGYQITPPSNWQVDTSGRNRADFVAFLPPVDGVTSNFNVVVVKSIPGENLAASGKKLSKSFASMVTNYHQISQRVTRLGGQPALETVATFSKSQSVSLHFHQIIAVTSNWDYVFTLVAGASQAQTCENQFGAALRTVKFASAH